MRPDSGIATSAAGAQSNPLADPRPLNCKERKEREEELFLFTPLAFFAFEIWNTTSRVSDFGFHLAYGLTTVIAYEAFTHDA